ncbi:hypothetical protein [Singulisphaera sp. PoT]|uniref:hypothetical protein n=1 Tax=Singulisphaera sp. PoT TaxID=3411797 RepID=UPI003BF59BF5
MPYLLCRTHGPQHEAGSASGGEEYRQAGETVLIVEGTLISGPWQCDSCNAPLEAGSRAWLVTAFPAHFRDDLFGYAFEYERQYFGMTKGDRAVSYGAPWPDDSIVRRRKSGTGSRHQSKIFSALDLFRHK